jgi:N utilization substance protein B
LTVGSTGTRRKGREAALQLLYQIEFTRDASERAFDDFWGSRAVADREERPFADALVHRVLNARDSVDALIDRAADNWHLDRIARMDLNLLRLGVVELMGDEALPPEIVMNEAIEIARKYCDAGASGFINGVLDRIVRELKGVAGGAGDS